MLSIVFGRRRGAADAEILSRRIGADDEEVRIGLDPEMPGSGRRQCGVAGGGRPLLRSSRSRPDALSSLAAGSGQARSRDLTGLARRSHIAPIPGLAFRSCLRDNRRPDG